MNLFTTLCCWVCKWEHPSFFDDPSTACTWLAGLWKSLLCVSGLRNEKVIGSNRLLLVSQNPGRVCQTVFFLPYASPRAITRGQPPIAGACRSLRMRVHRLYIAGRSSVNIEDTVGGTSARTSAIWLWYVTLGFWVAVSRQIELHLRRKESLWERGYLHISGLCLSGCILTYRCTIIIMLNLHISSCVFIYPVMYSYTSSCTCYLQQYLYAWLYFSISSCTVLYIYITSCICLSPAVFIYLLLHLHISGCT